MKECPLFPRYLVPNTARLSGCVSCSNSRTHASTGVKRAPASSEDCQISAIAALPCSGMRNYQVRRNTLHLENGLSRVTEHLN